MQTVIPPTGQPNLPATSSFFTNHDLLKSILPACCCRFSLCVCAMLVVSGSVSTMLQPGVGAIPQNLPSVCSMLLFNSKENPYKEVRHEYDMLPLPSSSPFSVSSHRLTRAPLIIRVLGVLAHRAPRCTFPASTTLWTTSWLPQKRGKPRTTTHAVLLLLPSRLVLARCWYG